MDNLHLRTILLQLQDRLSDHDRRRLHFLLGNEVSRRVQDDTSISGTLLLMESLYDQDKINERNLTLLINAFEKMHCYDAANLLREYHKQNLLNEPTRNVSLPMRTTANQYISIEYDRTSVARANEGVSKQSDFRKQRSTGSTNSSVSKVSEYYQLDDQSSDDHYNVSPIEGRLDININNQSNCLTNFQFIVLDISKRLDQIALAMLQSLHSMLGNSLLILDDHSAIDIDELPAKITYLFISSQLAFTMKSKPKQMQAMFILEEDKTKVDYRERFHSGVDFIFQLADEIYRCYKKEAKEYLAAGDLTTAKIEEELANQIHVELKRVYKSVSRDQNTLPTPINTTTIVIWLELNLEKNKEMEEMRRLLSKFISSFLVFDDQMICENYLLKNKSADIVYLIVNANQHISIGTDVKQLSNIKLIYSYEETSSNKYNDLCFRLISNLAAHYNQLGSLCSTRKDAKIAKDMFTKTYELYQILAKC